MVIRSKNTTDTKKTKLTTLNESKLLIVGLLKLLGCMVTFVDISVDDETLFHCVFFGKFKPINYIYTLYQKLCQACF